MDDVCTLIIRVVQHLLDDPCMRLSPLVPEISFQD